MHYNSFKLENDEANFIKCTENINFSKNYIIVIIVNTIFIIRYYILSNYRIELMHFGHLKKKKERKIS